MMSFPALKGGFSMKDLEQKVAYLQGLTDGLNLEESKEGKVISEMLGLMEEMIDYMGFLKEEQVELEEYIESIDSDLADLEDDFFDDEEDEDDDFVEIECPNCHEEVCFDAEVLFDDDLIEVTCPVCDTVVYVNGDEEDLDDELSFSDED
jgi:ribosomal protein S27E